MPAGPWEGRRVGCSPPGPGGPCAALGMSDSTESPGRPCLSSILNGGRIESTGLLGAASRGGHSQIGPRIPGSAALIVDEPLVPGAVRVMVAQIDRVVYGGLQRQENGHPADRHIYSIGGARPPPSG